MAKFSLTLLLFCLFTVSLARIPSENDDATTSIEIPLSQLTATFQPINPETESNANDLTTMPLTTVPFRPINRRFRVRSKQPCHHHFKANPAVSVKNMEIPYGNDMIISSGENSNFDDLDVVHAGEQRRVRIHHLHHHHHHHDEDSDSDSDDEDDKNKRIGFKRDRLDRGIKLKSIYKTRKYFSRLQNQENNKKENSGFMKRFNDFLDHYF